MPNPSASIIVPVFNSEKTIGSTLEAILGQDYSGSMEVIVVDDGSTDKTPQIVQTFRNIKYIRQDNRGPASARNRGFRESKGEIIFFTDSDCVPETNWVSKAVRHFTDGNIGVAAGSYAIANPESLLARSIQREIIFRHEKLMPKFSKSFGSYNFCVRRDVFAGAGGFDEAYREASGEDNDLSYKILKKGHRIYFDKNLLVRHYHTTRLLKYIYEQFRHGFWRVKMYLDHPQMGKGDDYTFWKDICEPPLVALYALGMMFSFSGKDIFYELMITPYLALIIIEFFYGFMMIRGFKEGAFWGSIMFLRAFSRSLGFGCGIAYFLPVFYRKFLQKK